ncbi:MAG: RdgB/HAM1 family non-canonical purine NTP pyrophosphatase [Prevotella sp.]|nr:RdgB/HAM1 family non-canonical purine NTP pyrophosphatase [Prevotella sp.]MCI7687189.1 RdgB/HAM1 family non-canonical purine NTP pyrophosphatase [Prevotella sp.]MDD6590452.1 RdgB/HAM1 family non-canonical purine NTP pyrophosphatase [Prevotella sp.]MDY3876252.1 RdgB/HAM1 family non-canonical purine NTP pyrophosphatase [Prevotella sp.]MDY3897449.1 RdgB/HAM1 family non-canonical purine NTP pyrophosphatase [Prevotella sp.]
MKIILATNNEHKLSEIRSIFDKDIEVLSMKDVGIDTDIEENGETIFENSRIKAVYVTTELKKKNFPFPYTVISDDTGLMVEALNGEPGVYSARYAGGEGHDSEANMQLLLKKLNGCENRKAHFSTIITLIEEKASFLSHMMFFEGRVDGTILKEKHGTEGFGYDPIFQPDGYDCSFAEMGIDLKNKISHRAIAIGKVAEYLAKK